MSDNDTGIGAGEASPVDRLLAWAESIQTPGVCARRRVVSLASELVGAIKRAERILRKARSEDKSGYDRRHRIRCLADLRFMKAVIEEKRAAIAGDLPHTVQEIMEEHRAHRAFFEEQRSQESDRPEQDGVA